MGKIMYKSTENNLCKQLIHSAKRLSFDYPSCENITTKNRIKSKSDNVLSLYPPKQLKNVLEYEEDMKIHINRNVKKNEEYKIILKYPINNSDDNNIYDDKKKKKRRDIESVNILDPPLHYCVTVEDEENERLKEMENEKKGLISDIENYQIVIPKFKSVEERCIIYHPLSNVISNEKKIQYLGKHYLEERKVINSVIDLENNLNKSKSNSINKRNMRIKNNDHLPPPSSPLSSQQQQQQQQISQLSPQRSQHTRSRCRFNSHSRSHSPSLSQSPSSPSSLYSHSRTRSHIREVPSILNCNGKRISSFNSDNSYGNTRKRRKLSVQNVYSINKNPEIPIITFSSSIIPMKINTHKVFEYNDEMEHEFESPLPSEYEDDIVNNSNQIMMRKEENDDDNNDDDVVKRLEENLKKSKSLLNRKTLKIDSLENQSFNNDNNNINGNDDYNDIFENQFLPELHNHDDLSNSILMTNQSKESNSININSNNNNNNNEIDDNSSLSIQTNSESESRIENENENGINPIDNSQSIPTESIDNINSNSDNSSNITQNDSLEEEEEEEEGSSLSNTENMELSPNQRMKMYKMKQKYRSAKPSIDFNLVAGNAVASSHKYITPENNQCKEMEILRFESTLLYIFGKDNDIINSLNITSNFNNIYDYNCVVCNNEVDKDEPYWTCRRCERLFHTDCVSIPYKGGHSYICEVCNTTNNEILVKAWKVDRIKVAMNIPHIWKGINGVLNNCSDEEEFQKYINKQRIYKKNLSYEFFCECNYNVEKNRSDVKLNSKSFLFTEPLRIYSIVNYFCDTSNSGLYMEYVLSTLLGLYKDIYRVIDELYIEIVANTAKEKFLEEKKKAREKIMSLFQSVYNTNKYDKKKDKRKSYIMAFDNEFEYVKDLAIGDVTIKLLPKHYNIKKNDVVYLLRTTSDPAIFAVGSIYEIKQSIDDDGFSGDDSDNYTNNKKSAYKWNCAVTITTQLPKYLSFEYVKVHCKSLDFQLNHNLFVKEITSDESNMILHNIKQHIKFIGSLPNELTSGLDYNDMSHHLSRISFPYSLTEYCCICCGFEKNGKLLVCSSCNRGFHSNCSSARSAKCYSDIWKCSICKLKEENKYIKGEICEICFRTLSKINTNNDSNKIANPILVCKTCNRSYHRKCICKFDGFINQKDWECKLCSGYRNRYLHLPEKDEWCCVCNNVNFVLNDSIHTCYCCSITRHDSCPDPYSNSIGFIIHNGFSFCNYCYNKYMRYLLFYRDIKRYFIKMECEAVVYRLIKNYVISNINDTRSTNKIISILQISKLLLADFLSSI